MPLAAFVAAARQRLYLLHAGKRVWLGQVREMRVSPFLDEIEEQLLKRAEGAAPRKTKRQDGQQLMLF